MRTPHYLAKDSGAAQRLHRLIVAPGFGALEVQAPVRLAWGTVCAFASQVCFPEAERRSLSHKECRVQAGVWSAEAAQGAAELVSRDYDLGLTHLAAGLELIEPHSALPLALRATADALLSLLLTTFQALPHRPPLLHLQRVVYTDAPPLVARFWQQDAGDELRGALLAHAVSVFPCQTEPLLLLLAPLVADAASARRAYEQLARLQLLCTWTVRLLPSGCFH